MSGDGKELFLLFQMGSSEEWTWYSVVGVFLSERALRDHAAEKEISKDLKVLEPDEKGDVVLPEPVEYVAVRWKEGEVPDVELGIKV